MKVLEAIVNLNGAMSTACGSRDTIRRDEGSKGDLTGKDRAEEGDAEGVRDYYGVSRLFVFAHLTDSGRKGNNTITGHSEDERESATIAALVLCIRWYHP